MRVDFEQYLDEFRARCRVMREERATHWGDISIELPQIAPAVTPDEKKPESEDEAELRRREETRRVALAASGRLVPIIRSSDK